MGDYFKQMGKGGDMMKKVEKPWFKSTEQSIHLYNAVPAQIALSRIPERVPYASQIELAWRFFRTGFMGNAVHCW